MMCQALRYSSKQNNRPSCPPGAYVLFSLTKPSWASSWQCRSDASYQEDSGGEQRHARLELQSRRMSTWIPIKSYSHTQTQKLPAPRQVDSPRPLAQAPFPPGFLLWAHCSHMLGFLLLPGSDPGKSLGRPSTLPGLLLAQGSRGGSAAGGAGWGSQS